MRIPENEEINVHVAFVSGEERVWAMHPEAVADLAGTYAAQYSEDTTPRDVIEKELSDAIDEDTQFVLGTGVAGGQLYKHVLVTKHVAWFLVYTTPLPKKGPPSQAAHAANAAAGWARSSG